MARPAQVMQGDGPVLDWELVYDLHAPKLRRTIQRRVGAALVEDVLQETFLKAFKNRASIDPTQPIGPWLGTIAVRSSTAVYRRQLRTVEAASDTERELDEVGLDSLEEEFLNRARRMGIKHAFASLSERQRRVLQLVTVEGMSYACAADAENTTPEAVRSLLARARTNFRSTYTDFGKESGLYGLGVFGLLRKLQRRFRSLQMVAGGHVAGVGAVSVTMAVVAIAAAPVVHQTATHAAERDRAVEAGPASPPVDDEDATATAGTSTPSPTSTPSDVPEPPAATVRTTLGRSGDQAGAGFTAQATAPDGEYRTWGVVTFHCDQGKTGPVACAAVDVLGVLPPPG